MRGFQKLSVVIPPHLHFSYVLLVWLTHHPPVCTPYDIIIARCQGSNKPMYVIWVWRQARDGDTGPKKYECSLHLLSNCTDYVPNLDDDDDITTKQLR